MLPAGWRLQGDSRHEIAGEVETGCTDYPGRGERAGTVVGTPKPCKLGVVGALDTQADTGEPRLGQRRYQGGHERLGVGLGGELRKVRAHPADAGH